MLPVGHALDIINANRKVAIVGLSPKEDRPSYRVAKFMMENGFEITPITPVYKEILGIPCRKNLGELSPNDVDWIDFFVNPAKLMDFSADVLQLKPKLVWCQIGIVNDLFNQELLNANIPYIADVCPKIELESAG